MVLSFAEKMAELTILREEERMLMRIASKLNDQLNRLKVEELTLLSRIRNNQSSFKTPASSTINRPVVTETREEAVNENPLDLEVKVSVILPSQEEEMEEEEEEEEEESDDEDRKHDQLTAFIQNMAMQLKPPPPPSLPHGSV